MATYRKTDVETHNEYYGKVRPAVNVKVYHFPSSYKIAEHFNCEEAQAEKAGEYAFQSACERFWEDAQSIFDEVYGPNYAKVYSEGRQGGWLIVDGLDNIDDWTLMQLNRWHSFETRIKSAVKWLTSEANIFDDISANKWTKDGAEQFNFVELPNGENKCIADLKAEAINAGFSPVIRK